MSNEVSTFFDNEAAHWSDRYAEDPRFERRFHKITRLIEKVTTVPGRALDIGCGSGVFSRFLVGKSWDVTGIDISDDMIEAAKNYELRITNYESNRKIDFQNSSFESFQEVPNSFDLILSLSMLEYVEDDEAALDKAISLLKPGGILLLSVPNRKGLLRIAESLIYGIRTVTKGKLFAGRGNYLAHQKRQYSPMELDLMLRIRGMKKKRGMFLGTGISNPNWLLPLFERRWWAAMYAAAYEKKS